MPLEHSTSHTLSPRRIQLLAIGPLKIPEVRRVSERVTYVTGTTVPTAWLNHAIIREMLACHFIVHNETASGTTTTYADATTPGGTSSNSTWNPGSVIQNAINNA